MPRPVSSSRSKSAWHIRTLSACFKSERGKAIDLLNSQNSDYESLSLSGRYLLMPVILRPLIFVAHSLGGLLVKQALVESMKQERDGQEHRLHTACSAVIFFGTPHRGSPDASLGLILTNMIKASGLDVNNSILRDLDPKSGSPTLSNLLEDFNSLLEDEHIDVYSFEESAGKTSIGLFSGKVAI